MHSASQTTVTNRSSCDEQKQLRRTEGEDAQPFANALSDVDGLTTLVPAAGGAHGVGQLDSCAAWAGAARWGAKFPVAGPTAADLHLGFLFLGYGHD